MFNEPVKAVNRGSPSLHLCAAALDAALLVFMLHYLPIKSLSALQGTCRALKNMVDRLPSDSLLAAFRAARLLPPAISEHLSSLQSWRAAVLCHADVFRRLRSGAHKHMQHQQLEPKQYVDVLRWSPSAQPQLAFLTHTCHLADSDELHVVDNSLSQRLSSAADMLSASQIMWHDWISERHLICEFKVGSAHSVAVLDTLASKVISRMRHVKSLLSPDKQHLLTWHASGKTAVHDLPSLQTKIRFASSHYSLAANPASISTGSSAAHWSSTGALIAFCWQPKDAKQRPHLLTISSSVDGSIVHTFNIDRILGPDCPTILWSSSSDMILLHGSCKLAAIARLDGSHGRLGRFQRVGWSRCGSYIHGLQALSPSTNDDSDCFECHIWDAANDEQVFTWQQRKGEFPTKTLSERQSIVWARDAPVCCIPDQQMLVLLPTFKSLGSATCRILLLTQGDCNPLPEPPSGQATPLDWLLSDCGRLLVNGGQDQRSVQPELPVWWHAEAQAPVSRSLQQGRVHLETPFCTMAEVNGAPADCGGVAPNDWPSGHYHATVAWHPTPAISRMYAACNLAGDVCLVDGRAAKAVCVWTRQQLECAGMPAGSGPLDLHWSPTGETLVVSRQGRITFICFGAAQ